MEDWSVGTVADGKAEEVVVAGAGLSINVVVGAVVLALLREVTAEREETGMLTSVPV